MAALGTLIVLLLGTPSSSPYDSAVRDLMVANGLVADVPKFALTTEALSSPEAQALLADPYLQELYGYFGRCALPAGTTVDVPLPEGTLVLEGRVGLAPSWADGPCDEACQEWVTACIAALTNYYDVNVEVAIGGTWSEEAKIRPEDQARLVQEGAFYGNMFAQPSRYYVCRGTGYDPLMMTMRRCARADAGCGFQWVGACGVVDGDTGVVAERHACVPEADGVYASCSSRATIEGEFPEPHRLYTRVVTTWLQRTSFSPCPDGVSALDPSAAERPDPTAANTCVAVDETTCVGAQCVNDDGCQSDKFLCDTIGLDLGMCTASCVDGAAADEEAFCGGTGTTCLSPTSGGLGFCTRACVPSDSSACPHGRACTGFWWTHFNGMFGSGDAPGCARFCDSDADCDPGLFCNTRTGDCQRTSPNPNGRKDGEPCSTDKPNPCRGSCWSAFGPGDSRGYCATLFELDGTLACPDPNVRLYYAPPAYDSVGLCLYKACSSGIDCTPPLQCRSNDLGPNAAYSCVYPN